MRTRVTAARARCEARDTTARMRKEATWVGRGGRARGAEGGDGELELAVSVSHRHGSGCGLLRIVVLWLGGGGTHRTQDAGQADSDAEKAPRDALLPQGELPVVRAGKRRKG